MMIFNPFHGIDERIDALNFRQHIMKFFRAPSIHSHRLKRYDFCPPQLLLTHMQYRLNSFKSALSPHSISDTSTEQQVYCIDSVILVLRTSRI